METITGTDTATASATATATATAVAAAGSMGGAGANGFMIEGVMGLSVVKNTAQWSGATGGSAVWSKYSRASSAQFGLGSAVRRTHSEPAKTSLSMETLIPIRRGAWETGYRTDMTHRALFALTTLANAIAKISANAISISEQKRTQQSATPKFP
ncbi:hypothetical protein DOTSEDRAFT_36996 [Dothistroma septosporum NZE10]|uniref:Uncharacterized protein n=1 Tax=Dothistroma septosporum (strain NZE10 / CBS 128990) TaxID=675120 RepID=N1PH04_DOTSN|nr:hypothetical protein DOTSEDRAFT_36996 [Dothistroma septosporum NZE10]